MLALLTDLRFAMRTLRRRRTFFAVAVITLGLGIGAATSIFSVVDGVLFRPLPFSEPGKLVSVYQTYPEWRNEPILSATWDHIPFSVPEYRDWRAQQTSFSDVAIYSIISNLLEGRDGPEQVPIVQASASMLPVLRVRPVLGRAFLPGEDVPGGPAVALVSHETWLARYGGDSTVIGRLVKFETKSYEIVGVLPPGLSLRRATTPPPQFWIPTQDSSDASTRGNHNFQALARLKTGVTFEQATLETTRIMDVANERKEPVGVRVTELQMEQTREVRKPLLVLLAAVALLLLIACVNVATLLVGEAASREHEMATRVALGAARIRLVRQLLTESLALAGFGALLGTVLAYGGTRVLVAMAPARIPGIADVRTDLRVLSVALAAAVVTGLLFGFAPALTLSRSGPGHLLRAGARESVRGRGRLQRVFVALQLALSVVLLVGAGLLSRSFSRLTAVDPGFVTAGLLAVRPALPRAVARDEAVRADYYRQSLERLAAAPGVVAVAGGTTTPFTGNSSTSVEIEGLAATPDASTREAQQRVITPSYFATLGIPVRLGRVFTDADRAGAPNVVIVSEAMARRDWPNASAIGKRVKYRGDWRTVVGVVGDIKFRTLASDPEPTVYAPFTQVSQGLTFFVRTRDDAAAAAPAVRATLASVNRAVPVTTIDTMDDLMKRTFAEERYRTMLIVVFGVLAAVLAAVGMYGVTSRAVSRRTREVGIRTALGASPRSVSTLIVGQTLAGVALGVAAGIVAALSVGRLLAPFLYGISNKDPLTYAGILVLLATVSVVASWLPARRAGRVPPATVLRSD
jgi:putative ABC transport system permease protein